VSFAETYEIESKRTMNGKELQHLQVSIEKPRKPLVCYEKQIGKSALIRLSYGKSIRKQNSKIRRRWLCVVPGLLNPEETKILVQAAHGDPLVQKSAIELADAQGGRIRLSGCSHAGDGTMGIVALTRRVVDRMESFLGGEVYHYHSKMILKEPHVGGAWGWHQDYGYWYQNGC
jgi:hypothetical protein